MTKRIYDARQLPALLSVAEYAQLMNLSQQTVRAQCRSGLLPCFRVGKKLWRIDKNAALDRINAAQGGAA